MQCIKNDKGEHFRVMKGSVHGYIAIINKFV